MNKKIIVGILVAIFIIAIIVAIVLITNNTKEQNYKKGNVGVALQGDPINKNNKDENKLKEEKSMYNTGKHHTEITIKNYGVIALELDADVAPITVENFAKLVNEGFYNGLTFHRIIKGFMIQGGDPKGNGTGGSDKEIKGEFQANGIKNTISHERGVISMARSNKFDSASSQFFIVHEDSKFLDGQYAAFGKVTSGIEIVDRICEDIKVEDNNGTVLKANQPVIEKIIMLD